jgi:formylglycine-generating enzyme required for sulfatase activity
MSELLKYKGLLFFILGVLFILIFNWSMDYTSTNEFCEGCHVHPQASQSWRLGAHFDNKSGVVVSCVDCHLPPGGAAYLMAKTTTGLRDVIGMIFKNTEKINWEMKSTREMASEHVFKSSCIYCHQNLYPRTLSKKGSEAHLYYDQKSDVLRCINCHLETGHFHRKMSGPEEPIRTDEISRQLYKYPAVLDSFISFKEMIPGTSTDFEMIALPGGTTLIGSPESETYRREDEGPQIKIKINPFWMGKWEVAWEEYEIFLKEAGVQGRSEDQYQYVKQSNTVDAVTGPTPAYGNPDQGWGKGKRPAITMSHFAAQKYCEWLSKKTGKTYRLPTEAEWEYACRATTSSAYFFDSEPEQLSENRLWNRIFGMDTTVINQFVRYSLNSQGKTHPPQSVGANPFGLLHMLGNVREFCSDWYQSNSYSLYTDEIIENPSGPDSGTQYVVRGGSFRTVADNLRSAARDHTEEDRWLLTDPQRPKSLWWYSDCNDVGFRVVCEYDEKEIN